MSTPEQVQVGRIVKPHGIRGEVAVDLTSDVAGRFAADEVVTGHDGRSLTVRTSRPHQGRLLVRFAEVGDRTAAESLRGLRLFAASADVADSDYFYAHELVGLLVIHEDGRVLGFVQDLVELPEAAGYDLLEVAREDGSTWLLPAADDYVEVHEDADGEDLLVLVDPPVGLLDLDDEDRGPASEAEDR